MLRTPSRERGTTLAQAAFAFPDGVLRLAHDRDHLLQDRLRLRDPRSGSSRGCPHRSDYEPERAFRLAVFRGSRRRLTPPRAPRANAFCERLIGTLRRDCVDHVIVLDDLHAERVLREYVPYYSVGHTAAAGYRHRLVPSGLGRQGQRRSNPSWPSLCSPACTTSMQSRPESSQARQRGGVTAHALRAKREGVTPDRARRGSGPHAPSGPRNVGRLRPAAELLSDDASCRQPLRDRRPRPDRILSADRSFTVVATGCSR